jgi:pimeloyl-ACP methyl ester carboxylesterase
LTKAIATTAATCGDRAKPRAWAWPTDIPVRILWGTEDAWIPTEIAKKLHSLIPGATLSLIDGAGHLMHHDAPVALMNEMRAWLESVDRETG